MPDLDPPFPDRYALSHEVESLPDPPFIFDFQTRLLLTLVSAGHQKWKFVGCCLDDTDPGNVPVMDVMKLMAIWLSDVECDPTVTAPVHYVLMSRELLAESLAPHGGLPDWLVLHEIDTSETTCTALLCTRPWGLVGFSDGGLDPGANVPFTEPYFFAGPAARPNPFGPWLAAARSYWQKMLPQIS